jgi:hypothetical protein
MQFIHPSVGYFQRRSFLLGAWASAKAIVCRVITVLIRAIGLIARIFAFEDQGTAIGLLAFLSQSWLCIVVACGILGAFGLILSGLMNNTRKRMSVNKLNSYLREIGTSEKERQIWPACELVNPGRDEVTEIPPPGDSPDPTPGSEVASVPEGPPGSPLLSPWDDPSFGLETTPELQLELLRIAEEAEEAEDAARQANQQDMDLADLFPDTDEQSLGIWIQKL